MLMRRPKACIDSIQYRHSVVVSGQYVVVCDHVSGYLRSDFAWHSPLRHSLPVFRRLTLHCGVACSSLRAIRGRPCARSLCTPGVLVDIYVLFIPTED